MSTTSSGFDNGGIGRRIRALRDKRHWTQVQLANREYSVPHISAIERGKIEPSRDFLVWCAGRLGVTVAELKGDSLLASPDGRWIQAQYGKRGYEQIYAQLLITCGEIEEGLRRVRHMRREATAPSERMLIWFSALGACLAGDLEAAMREAAVYQRMVEQSGDPRGATALHWLLGRIALAEGDVEKAHLEFARALAAEQDGLGDPDTAQSIRRSLIETLWTLHDAALAHQEEAAALREYESATATSDSLRLARARAEAAASVGDYTNAYMLIRWAWNSQRESTMHRHAAELYLRHATYANEHILTEQREAELRRAAMLAELTGATETRLLAGAYRTQLAAERGALAVAEEVMHLMNATAETSGALVADEQIVLVALARGWVAAARGNNKEAHRLAVDVLEALRKEPAFTRTDAKFAGLALWRLFERLGDEERAFAALKWATSQRE